MGVPRATVDKTRVSDFPRYGVYAFAIIINIVTRPRARAQSKIILT